jgi:hypothetical protein
MRVSEIEQIFNKCPRAGGTAGDVTSMEVLI